METHKRIPLFTPIVGNGKYKVNPVHMNDLVNVLIDAIDNKKSNNKKYYIVGPKNLEFNEFVDIINEKLGIKRIKLHIPLFMSFILAKIMEKLLNNSPLTTSTVKATKTDKLYSIKEAKKDFNYNPTSFKEGIKKVKNGI